MTRPPSAPRDITRAVIRLQAGVLALVCGVLGGIGLFVMTAWLVIKGGPQVGPHLGLLGNYFIGYTVTWGGAFVGLVYGALVGAIGGWVVGSVYNIVADTRASR